MKKEIKNIIIILVVLAAFSTNAQKMTLNQAIDIAQKQNILLKAAGLDIDSKQMLVKTAKELPKAQVELQYGNIQNPFVGDYLLGITQTFEHKKVYQARKDLLTAYLEESKASLTIQKADISLKIKSLYHSMAYFQALNDLMTKQDSLYLLASSVANARYKAGESNLLEKMSIETQYKDLQNRIVKYKSQYETAYYQLVNVLNWRDTLRIESQDFMRKKISMADYSQNPTLNYLQKVSEGFAKETALEQQRLRPDFKVGIINQSMQGSIRQFIIQGGIGIPIFKDAQKARIEAAKINQQAAATRIEALENQLINELRGLQNQLKRVSQTLDYYEKNALPQADLLTEMALKRYKAGEIDYLEWHQNHVQAQIIKEQYLQTVWNYQDIITQIEYLSGM